ncbi:alpha/beta fold hydrolase [Umezawaea tangerina]|uniref:Pimeloyl-ACP methyl ester carboxylesterase n=1 Tax=Umezawaea tangerina TaxID=84725 RepID=A0A2T0TLK4_9PSEU|nr:alpha/beta hydrolase [Umezawaea tangerina]PRY46525.1 pimeloyl-ACP methyl ester carboxylesterase [Umezawaea tangerina]
MTGEKLLPVNGVELCVQTFGEPTDPPVLLIAGSASPMTFWEEEFCERLTGRFVIRYDSRDTGRSVTYPPGAPEYGFTDLLDDAVGVLDALGVESAHVVGISMGGGIAQLMALEHPERVTTLTLIATSPSGPGADDLPPVSEGAVAFFTGLTEPDWSDRTSVVDHVVGVLRWFSLGEFDEQAARAGVERDFDRTSSFRSSSNHQMVTGGEPWRERLDEVRAPTLVLHGTEDPLFDLAHAHALVAEIPDATLVTLPGVGHELPRSSWDVVVPAILGHSKT